MADSTDKTPKNTPGKFYNDNTCIDCGLCPEIAPEIFRRDDDEGVSYVFHQPNTQQERGLAQKAVDECPTESIGNDG